MTSSRLSVSSLFVALLAAPASAQVDRIAPLRFPLEVEGHSLALPYHATHELGEIHQGLTTAFIMVHGTLRNAHSYQPWAISAVRAARADAHTLVLSPQFLIEEDLAVNTVEAEVPFWTGAGWKRGDPSRSTAKNARKARISSYEVMDRMLLRIRETLPDLERVLVVGHSAGGQYAHRYAISTPLVDTLAQRGVSLEFFIANPSSYTYFTRDRPLVDGARDFQEPLGALLQACPDFNRFIFGCDGLNQYIGRLPVAELAAQYASRRVTYLLGADDNDPDASYLDTSCGAMLQGTNRLDRGLNYHRFLGRHFGAEVHARHTLVVVPDVGHSVYRILNSRAGLAAIFPQAAAPQTR